MGKRYYIAYGSNLSEEQMAFRCPDAKPVGMAVLKDWKLAFRTHATVEPCEGRVVPVLVWEISEQDERSLDLYEGWPHYYRKENLPITITNFRGQKPKKITAMAYVMNDGHEVMPPMKGYYDVLDKAYTRYGFNRHQLELSMKEAKEAVDRELS